MSKYPKIGIIGAGIGGVTLARSLSEKGIDFTLFDQAPEFGEVGAGIQMSPNAIKVLSKLCVRDDISQNGFLPEFMVGKNWNDASELFKNPIKNVFKDIFGADYYHIHRADLHNSIIKNLPLDNFHFNHTCTKIEEKNGKSIATFDNGETFEADLIIGADGIRSVVRESLWGKDEPRFTGHMCWRALVSVDEFPLSHVDPGLTLWLGPKAHVVTYYVKNGKTVNIVACVETDDWEEESWSEPSSMEELVSAFEGWHPDLLKLLKQTDSSQIFKWGLYGREPMNQWSSKNTTLLGDAAHPMLPYLSQGAAMAIEDAYVLGEAIEHYKTDLESLFHAYELERRGRTKKVQLESANRGETYHLESEEAQEERNKIMKEKQEENPNAVGIDAEWVYEYDATTCKERFN